MGNVNWVDDAHYLARSYNPGYPKLKSPATSGPRSSNPKLHVWQIIVAIPETSVNVVPVSSTGWDLPLMIASN